jgi:hypothetical protein
MTMFQAIDSSRDHVMATLVAGLEAEFGRGAGEALAQRFLMAEEADFLWQARTSERWLGSYEDPDGDDQVELDRIAVMGRLNGAWFVASLIVDGEGMPHGVLGRRNFRRVDHARKAFAAMH